MWRRRFFREKGSVKPSGALREKEARFEAGRQIRRNIQVRRGFAGYKQSSPDYRGGFSGMAGGIAITDPDGAAFRDARARHSLPPLRAGGGNRRVGNNA